MSLIPWAPSQWTDDLGRPLAFGKLYLYQAGTAPARGTACIEVEGCADTCRGGSR